MFTKKLWLSLSVLLIAVMVLSACATPAPTEAPVATEAPATTEAPAATEAPVVTEAPAAAPIIGLLLVGPANDAGWSQAHYDSMAYVQEKIPGTELLYLENVYTGSTAHTLTPAELAAAELPAAKHFAIAANRAECSRRIYARYPAGRQSSVALGVYSGAEAEAQAQVMKDWISDMVAAENTAADAIEAATTVAAVEAVTVAWPV